MTPPLSPFSSVPLPESVSVASPVAPEKMAQTCEICSPPATTELCFPRWSVWPTSVRQESALFRNASV